MNLLVPVVASRAPALVATCGPRASYRFLEFFTANIRNPHTRRAYARAAVEFFDWPAAKGVTQLAAMESVQVAAYIEELAPERRAPTAKLRLASLKHLLDWVTNHASTRKTQPYDRRAEEVTLDEVERVLI